MMTYQCDYCDYWGRTKTFTMKKNLYRHLRDIHLKERLHECSICHKKFARKQHKDLHLQRCGSALLEDMDRYPLDIEM